MFKTLCADKPHLGADFGPYRNGLSGQEKSGQPAMAHTCPVWGQGASQVLGAEGESGSAVGAKAPGPAHAPSRSPDDITNQKTLTHCSCSKTLKGKTVPAGSVLEIKDL